MSAPASPPPLPRKGSNGPWNLGFAGVFLVLAVWTLVADLSLQAHILLQTSPSTLLLALFLLVWLSASTIFATFPKRFVVAATVIAMSRFAFAWPLLYAIDLRTACLLLDGLLVGAAAAYLVWSLQSMTASLRPVFCWKHFCAMTAVGIISLILSLPANYLGLVEVIKNVSGGYVRFSLQGVDLTERVFEKDGRRVHLIGMAHIGDSGFYETLNHSIAQPVYGRRLVLLEGVTDTAEILPSSFSSGHTYRTFAGKLGLVDQAVGFAARPEGDDAADAREAWAEAGVDFRRADIDVSELSPEHRERLVSLLTSLEDVGLADLFKLPDGLTAADFQDLMVNGLLKQRNDRLMESFAAAERDYAEIFIPWGAAHLPDLDRRLSSLGYRVSGEHTRRVIDFTRLFRSR